MTYQMQLIIKTNVAKIYTCDEEFLRSHVMTNITGNQAEELFRSGHVCLDLKDDDDFEEILKQLRVERYIIKTPGIELSLCVKKNE